MKKIKQFHCSHCGKLNYVPTAPSAWREQLPEFLRVFTTAITPQSTGDLIDLGRKLGMWTSTPAGAAKLSHMAEEYLIRRQGHGWWILTDIGMDLILAAGLQVEPLRIQQLSDLEEQPDPDCRAGGYLPTADDRQILQIVAESPQPISDRIVFRLGNVAGRIWASRWSVGRRAIKILIANGLLTRPKVGLLSVTEGARKYLPEETPLSRQLAAVDRTSGVND